MSSVPKRMIIQAFNKLFNENYDIIKVWFYFYGFSKDDETYFWIKSGHYIYVGAEDGGRFHIIIDMNKDFVQNSDLKGLLYEIWRVTKNSEERP
jgi:hypothetical protein